jgi:hypothetical protein
MLQGAPPSTTLRVVPLPRRFAAWEEGAAAGLILPHGMGEGDRPKGGGGGSAAGVLGS